MSLFKKRDHYKPFEYPQFYDAFVISEQMHWSPREVSLSQDVKDWHSVLSGPEKELLTNIFRFFTQADVDVAGAYIDLYMQEFQAPEIRMMLSSIAAREAVHMQAYSMLIDEVGMPESEYATFMKYDVMRKKHDAMQVIKFDPTTPSSLAREIAIFSGFGEGLQLFASFVILLNFTRFGKMTGMGQIVSWSIRDETHHVDSMVKLFHALKAETDTGEYLESDIQYACEGMVELEDTFIDLAFGQAEIEGLTKEDVKEYIRYIADIRLGQLGCSPIYHIKTNPLPWVDTIVFGKEHANFFEQSATDYAKGSSTGSWDDDAFDFSEGMVSLSAGTATAASLATPQTFAIWSKPGCPHCEQAAELLAKHDIPFDYVVHDTPEKIAGFKELGFSSFPQIWVGAFFVGGLEDLRQLLTHDKALADGEVSDNIGSAIPAPQEGASCSLEGDCS